MDRELDKLRNIRIEDYTYNLPDERIAKFPLAEREASKLLIYSLRNGITINDWRYTSSILTALTVVIS